MIRVIAAKEFLTCLLTWRFGLAVTASVVLMSVSAVVLRADYARRLDAHEAELARIRADLEDIKFYAQLEETVSRPPSPLSVFSEGLEKRMGTILRFSHAKVPTMLTWKKETNPLVAAFPPFDLATVAGLLFSLMALFFAFDAVSGEQEGNTLKLMAANRVARWQILVGKWLGGGACSLLPATVGFLLATLILAGSPRVSLSGGQWLRVGLIFATVLLYTSAFYLAGLAVSSRARLSGTALVACIAVWAGCTIAAPAATAYVVGEVVPLPPERELKAQWEEIDRRLSDEFFDRFMEMGEDYGRRLGRDYSMFGSTMMFADISVGGVAGVSELFRETVPVLTEFYGRFEPRRIAAGRDIAEVEDRLVHARARQVGLTSKLSRLFVAPAFRNAVSALAGTDLRSFEGFIEHARRHRATLAAWMREQGLFTSVLFFSPVPEDKLHSREETRRRSEERDRRPLGFGDGVDTSRVPGFPDYRPSVATLLGGAGPDLAVLLTANALALFLGLRWFVRRQIG